MEEVQARKETVLITKRGKPVAKLVPAEKGTDGICGFLIEKGSLGRDLALPALSREDWGDLVLSLAGIRSPRTLSKRQGGDKSGSEFDQEK
jgi:antitoxin (DNA-binding transcriptional repressor) of toxin-antitoxin stability system